ncbi:MAG: YraN family protein [Alphaproteobacteria bacterium]|nr:YraN family protein [Alphaproteobacteria bacterium]
MTRERRRAEHKGRRAETRAALMLRLKGYRILAHRYRSPVGEIDLVAKRGHTLLAVEVKSRKSAAEAAFAIDARQQKRIARAAEHFLAANPRYADHKIRFDAILDVPKRLPRHIMDAWRIT